MFKLMDKKIIAILRQLFFCLTGPVLSCICTLENVHARTIKSRYKLTPNIAISFDVNLQNRTEQISFYSKSYTHDA